MSTENNSQNKGDYKPSVSWFLRRNRVFKMDGTNGPFCKARVLKGTILPDGKDISNFTYTFNAEKLQDIKVYESSPDFIKDEDFRKNNGVVYYNEDTEIKLTEPYDKENPDKELQTITVKAKVLSEAQKNRQIPDKADTQNARAHEKSVGTKERLTQRTVSASQAKSDSKEHDRLKHSHNFDRG